jgi:glyoxylase-like metal-dependent hydrolase (beta-lactamase superfamily II)
VQIADGIHRMGTRYVNWYLVEEGGKLTVVDTGFSAYYRQLPIELNRLGKSLSDVTAVLLTHNHTDHAGSAERTRKETGCIVMAHPADAALVRGEVKAKPPPGFLGNVFGHWAGIRYLAHAMANGAAKTPPVAELREFAHNDVLHVPGKPRVIHMPGHTPGHCALLFEGKGAVFTGDGLVTLDPTIGATGPRVMSIGTDVAQARDSLKQISGVPASLMLASHGDPWTNGVDEAISAARGR